MVVQLGAVSLRARCDRCIEGGYYRELGGSDANCDRCMEGVLLLRVRRQQWWCSWEQHHLGLATVARRLWEHRGSLQKP